MHLFGQLYPSAARPVAAIEVVLERDVQTVSHGLSVALHRSMPTSSNNTIWQAECLAWFLLRPDERREPGSPDGECLSQGAACGDTDATTHEAPGLGLTPA